MALSPEELNKVSELKQKGFSNTQIMGYIASTRRGMTSAISEQIGEIPDKEVQKELSYGQRVIDTNSTKLAQRVEQFGASADRFNAGEQGLLETGVQQAGTALAAGVVDPVTSIVSNTPIVKQGLELAGKGINALATSKYSPIKYLGDFFGNSEKLQEAVKLYDTDPQFKQTVDSTANIINAATTLAGGISSGTKLVNTGIDVTKQGGQMLANAGSGITQTADDVYKNGLDLAQKTKNIISSKVSGKNIDPQLQTSAERLAVQSEPRFLEGVAERVDDPLNLYDEYLNSSKAALTDTKLDPAISKVGSDIGDAFKEVVKQRKDVGKVLASELDKVKTVKTDVLPVVDTFVNDLKENGLVYDRVTKNIRPTTAQVKIGTADQRLLQNYAQELQVLGSKPSVGEIDAFISRINDDLKLYKATNNIVGTTNAERIMLKSLGDLRNQLTKSAGVPYTEARALYSDLSRFLENGESYLGKITESGDFAKDASLAKSSVQSILNNGKKDWLVELEALTGKPLLDKSVLALQAMKDAGDFRGVSLLEILNDGAVPTSKAGITQKIIDYALAKTGEALVGSPEEQTRRFLSELLQQR